MLQADPPMPHNLDLFLESYYLLRRTRDRQEREHLTCHGCGERGHIRSECQTYKTRICWNWTLGGCTIPACSFAHGPGELRPRRRW